VVGRIFVERRIVVGFFAPLVVELFWWTAALNSQLFVEMKKAVWFNRAAFFVAPHAP